MPVLAFFRQPPYAGVQILDEGIMYVLPLVGYAGVLFGFGFLTLAIGE